MSGAALFALTLAVAAPALPPSRAPEVRPDHTVVFRFVDPHAQAVRLVREGLDPLPMTRGADGVWTLTAGPWEPDLYGYSYEADGVSLMDPANPGIKPNLIAPTSLLHVPGPSTLPWEVGPEPRGAVHHHFYHSAVAGDDRDYYVYTPPGYDDRSARHYPVLYLLHGFSDDASAWTAVGRANVILDHLIDAGQAMPMIVVMPYGYGTPEILKRGFDGPLADHARRNRNIQRFRETLFREVIPRVQQQYRVEADPDTRAIAGLSMGGGEALAIGLNHLEDFHWIGAFSAAVGSYEDDQPDGFEQSYPKLTAGANDQIRLLWITCGEQDSLVSSVNHRLRAWLSLHGVRYSGADLPGQHTWLVWRRNLATFAPLLFREQ